MDMHARADVAKRQPYSGFDRLPIAALRVGIDLGMGLIDTAEITQAATRATFSLRKVSDTQRR
jgi:hypothetical protein